MYAGKRHGPWAGHGYCTGLLLDLKKNAVGDLYDMPFQKIQSSELEFDGGQTDLPTKEFFVTFFDIFHFSTKLTLLSKTRFHSTQHNSFLVLHLFYSIIMAGRKSKTPKKEKKERTPSSSSRKKRKEAVDETEESEQPMEVAAQHDEEKEDAMEVDTAPNQKDDDSDDDDAHIDPIENGDLLDNQAEALVKKPPPPPTMDVTVHRLRHLDYLPKPMVCLRATPQQPPQGSNNSVSSFVALSRDNGSVELKAPNEKFRTIAEIAGYKQKVVNAMAWTCGVAAAEKKARSSSIGSLGETPTKSSSKTSSTYRPTLVGGSRDGTLFVVDFATGTFTGMTASGGGGVFCLTSMCQNHAGRCCTKSNCAQLVAAGCEDGSIRIWKVINHRKLELVSILPSASGASILSLAWRKSTTHNGSVLFCGISDGTIRRYDCEDPISESMEEGVIVSESSNPKKSRTYDDSSGGSWMSRLRMTVESLGRNTPTQVWALHALADGTVISGDSLGHVQFWDGDTGTLLQSFDQNDNKADVLEIAVASEECKIFASGVDSRVVCIERPNLNNMEAAGATAEDSIDRKWILTQAQRPHTHDVKAMTVCHQQVNNGPDSRTRRLKLLKGSYSHEVLCTGGIDTKLCTYYVEGFKKLRPQSLYPWPAFSPVVQAKDARVLLLRREGQIDVYKLGPQQTDLKRSTAIPEDDSRVGTIELDSACNLVAIAISDDGKYLAACDPLALLIFKLEYIADGDGTSMIPTKLDVDAKKIKGSIVSMKFGSNDTLIAAASNGSIHVIKMPEDDHDDDDDDDDDDNDTSNTCTHFMVLKQKQAKALHKDVIFPVQAISFSKDKHWFAALQGGQDCSSVRIFSCEEDGKTYRHWWSLPDLERPATAVKFLETKNGAPELVVTCSNFAFYNFDVCKRRLAPWSEKSGVPVSKHLPQELTGRNDYPIRITSNPASPAKILLVRNQFC